MARNNNRQQNRGNSRQQRNQRSNNQGRSRDDEALRGKAASNKTQNVKRKPPVTTGKAVLLSIIISFFMITLAAAALIFFNMQSRQSDYSVFKSQIDDAVTQVREASEQITLAPSEGTRKAALDANVNIEVTRAAADGKTTTGYGAGVILTQDGLIVTNWHVLEGFQSIKCIIGEDTYEVQGSPYYDDLTDIAVIQIKPKASLPVASINEKGDVQPGDWCMSVGNPYGMTDSIVTGNIAATGRNFTMHKNPIDVTYANMIQFSAAVREGASGGGLYDIQGKLIGICTTMSVEEAHPADIGYAIPITYVVPITQRLKEGKLAMHATIGARYTAVPEEDIDRFGLDSSEGAYIDNVTPNGVAHQAGMMKGDIIVSIDGKKITEPMDAIYTIWAKQPGDQIEVLVLREGKEQQFTVKLGSDNNA